MRSGRPKRPGSAGSAKKISGELSRAADALLTASRPSRRGSTVWVSSGTAKGTCWMDPKDEATAAESVLDSRGRPAAAELVLGPMLRYAGTKSASFWLETNRPCEVEILGRRDRTFCVEGHHYALLLVDDLQPASLIDYDVRLDGRVVWPPDDGRPGPVVHTRRGEREVRL